MTMAAAMSSTSILLPRSNIDTPQSKAVFGISLVFTITSLISVVLRLQAKRVNRSPIVTEDYLCITSLILVIGMFISLCLMIGFGGLGHDVATLSPTDSTFIFRIMIGYQPLYCLAVATVKSSLCFFYVRIFGTTRSYRIVAYSVVAFIAAWAIFCILVAFVSCTPFAYTWDPTIVGGYCDNEQGSWVAEAVIDLVADIMVFALPMKSIWQLQINSEKRLILTLIFGLGISTMIMAILRVAGLHDFDWMLFQTSAIPPLIYSILEPAIGISVACIPLMQPLIKDTWLGKKLAKSGVKHPKPVYRNGISSNAARGYGREANELSLVLPTNVSITGGEDSPSISEDSESFNHKEDITGITKTDDIHIARGL